MNIGAILSRAIKQGTWLYISYKNLREEVTYFWISIIDIFPEDKSLSVYGFNYEISTDVKRFDKIYIERILSAQIIEGTYYQDHVNVMRKIDENYMSFEWLQYFDISEKVLSYYEACHLEDVEIEEHNFSLLEGFDEFQLTSENDFLLNEKQRLILLKLLKKKLSKKASLDRQSIEKLTYNLLAIKTKRNTIIPLFYYDMKFDITENRMVVIKTVKYNPKFKTKEFTYNLIHMVEAQLEKLANAFITLKEEVIRTIQQSLRRDEMIDTRPYIMRFSKSIMIPIADEYATIKDQFFQQTLPRPLNAFFGRFSNINRRKKRTNNLLLLDDKVNLEQLRAMYQALNQDITYVQGPPGTGKTTLIKNVILSSLLNQRSVLITSNNNEAIDHILRGFPTDNQLPMLPALRLGNLEYAETAMATIANLHALAPSLQMEDDRYEAVLRQSTVSIEDLNNVLEAYEEKIELESQAEILKQILEQNKDNLAFIKIQDDLTQLESKLKALANIDKANIFRSIRSSHQAELARQFLELETSRRLKKLLEPKYESLLEIIKSNKEDRVYQFLDYLKDDNHFHDLLKVFPVIFSTNIGARRLGPTAPHFDLLIMDEAGQSAVATSLIPMARAERLLLVGDASQLQPITQIDPKTNQEYLLSFGIPKVYDYANNSILKLMQTVDTKSPSIMLKEHYRSDRKIIGFSNQKYYANQLVVKKEDQPAALRFIQVKSNTIGDKNTAYEEAVFIAKDIKRLGAEDVGVITPFKNQAALINQSLDDLGLHDVKVGTIHTFQGNENKTIYLSLGLTNQTSQFAYDWIKDNQELMNVATTRAKDKLIVVGDEQLVTHYNQGQPSDLHDLVQYTKTFGQYEVKESSRSEQQRQLGVKALNSKFETDFLHTIQHFLTIYGAVKIKEKIKISDLFTIPSSAHYFSYANTAHLDFVIFDLKQTPLMAIELNGEEHYLSQEVKARDEKKKQILATHGLKLISIPNHYARRYDLIRATILTILEG